MPEHLLPQQDNNFKLRQPLPQNNPLNNDGTTVCLLGQARLLEHTVRTLRPLEAQTNGFTKNQSPSFPPPGPLH